MHKSGGENHKSPYYIKDPFVQEPDFDLASINYDLNDLMSRAIRPEETL